MTTQEMKDTGDRANRAASAMRQQGDMQAAERWLQLAEYYWNLAAAQPRQN